MRKIKNKNPIMFSDMDDYMGFKEFKKKKILEYAESVDYECIRQKLNDQVDTMKETKSYIVSNMKLQFIQRDLNQYIDDNHVLIYSLNKWIKDIMSAYPKDSSTLRIYKGFLSPVQLSIQFVAVYFDILEHMKYIFPKGLPVESFIDYLTAMTDHLKSDSSCILFLQEEALVHWYMSTVSYINEVDTCMRQWADKNKGTIDGYERLPSAIWMDILADRIIINPRNLKDLMKLHSMISILYFVYGDDKDKEKNFHIVEE